MQILKTGVYLMPWYLPCGSRVAVAIDARGYEVGRGILVPSDDPSAVARRLWQAIDGSPPGGASFTSLDDVFPIG